MNTYEVCYKFTRRELNNATDNGAQYAFRKLLETSPFNKFLDANKRKSYCKVDNYVNDVMVRNIYLNEDTLFAVYTDEALMRYFFAFRGSYLYKAGNAECCNCVTPISLSFQEESDSGYFGEGLTL